MPPVLTLDLPLPTDHHQLQELGLKLHLRSVTMHANRRSYLNIKKQQSTLLSACSLYMYVKAKCLLRYHTAS